MKDGTKEVNKGNSVDKVDNKSVKQYFKLILFLSLFISVCLHSTTSFTEESPDNNRPIVLQFNWLHQFQFAGYYAALDQGYFRDENLNVILKEGGPDINSVSEVLQKKAHYGIGSGGLLYRRLQNKPVVVVASIFQHSAAALAVAKASDINTPHDLVGKQVNMLIGGKPIIEIAAMLEYEGVRLDKVTMGENKLIVESETYDNVEFIYLTNSPYFIEKNHQQVHFIKPISYGIDFYGDALFTTESEIKQHPDTVEKMRSAIIKGWRYALQNPDEIIQKMQANYSIRHSSEHLKYEASIIQQLILPNVVEVGYSNASRWKRMADTMIRLKMISSSEHFDGFIYQTDDEKNVKAIWGILGFILALVCIVSLISIAFFFINRQLKKRIALKTAQLQQYNNELEHTVSLRTQALHLEIKKQQQATLEAKKANQAKGKFLATMSHEIRTPLNAVIGSYFLLMRTPLDTPQKAHLQQIYSSSQALCHIIDDILDFSKAEAGTLAFKAIHFNLAKLTQQLQQNFVTEINNKNITLNIHIDPYIPKKLNGFKQRLMQVLNNLLSNAIKFSPENAIVALHIENEKNKDSSDKQHILRFKVIDNGIGIEQHDMKKLFKPFSQINNELSRNYTGTGLGLSIAQNLVKVMGGELHCHSLLHQGSTFSFSIPLNESSLSTLEVINSSDADKLASLHLLLVDDNKLNLFIAEAFIKPYVAKISTASSGKEAIARCNKETFAMVLMDIQMPEMDGYQTTYHIRQNKALSYLPIIAMTANIAPDSYEESLAAGMNDHITKPLDPDVLLATLHKWS